GFNPDEYDFQHELLIRAFWCAYTWDILAAIAVGELPHQFVPSELPRLPDQDERYYDTKFEAKKLANGESEIWWEIPSPVPNPHYYSRHLITLVALQGHVSDLIVRFRCDNKVPSIEDFISADQRLIDWYDNLPPKLLPPENYADLRNVPRLEGQPMIDEITMLHLIWLHSRILLHKLAMTIILDLHADAVYRIDGPFGIRHDLPTPIHHHITAAAATGSEDPKKWQYDTELLRFSRQ
ncbi:hypothetical protein EV182_005524, partial [Spiromyces aspiralis]